MASAGRASLASAEDKVTGKNFNQRKPLVEKRILGLGKTMQPNQVNQANQWSMEEVIDRWLLLFPSTKKERREERAADS